MIPLIILCFIGFLLVIFGLFMTKGKFLNLIAGYNTLSAAEKAKIDKKKMGKRVGLYLVLIGFLTLILGVFITWISPSNIAFIITYAVIISVSAIFLIKNVNKK